MRLLNYVSVLTSLLIMSLPSWALSIGDEVSSEIPIYSKSGGLLYSIPLPPGKWILNGMKDRTGGGSASPAMRDYELGLIENGFLKMALEIVVLAEDKYIRWNDEPCKLKTPILYKNDFGTSLWKQKCLTVHPTRFLQGNNEATQRAVDVLIAKNIKNDFNAIQATYTRYGEKNRFIIYKLYIFPSVYGLENPLISNVNLSPWYPARVDTDVEKKKFVSELVSYLNSVVRAIDARFEGENPIPIKDLIYPLKEVDAMPATESVAVKKSIEERLISLKNLKDKLLISEDEFTQKRKEILEDIK